jgi:4-phosphopantoate--beta-alanine ligase
MTRIPNNHPRYHSLIIRERLVRAMKKGIVHQTGLIAQGRGEAFDYMLGESTIPSAEDAERVAAAALLIAKNPVISINGNVAALVPDECISLAEMIPAKLEVNLFHRTIKRVNLIIKTLRSHGELTIYGDKVDAKIPGLQHDRGLCSKDGIFSADVVLVPLEDGDRCQALRNMEKLVITIDLNPLSRTSRTASITIVDNIVRAIPNIKKWVCRLKYFKKDNLNRMVDSWNNREMLREVLQAMSKRLNVIY